ncbi:MAG: hypothetical protein IPL07_21620 [Acidimicrobiaceae bacterium]|nr:hypothetical protein [Acidimicrobiaceae bacterium]
MSNGSGSVSGVMRRTPLATGAADVAERRMAGTATTIAGGDAATRKGRSR